MESDAGKLHCAVTLALLSGSWRVELAWPAVIPLAAVIEALLALALCLDALPAGPSIAFLASLPVTLVLAGSWIRSSKARSMTAALGGIALATLSLLSPATWLLALLVTLGAAWLGAPLPLGRARWVLFGLGAAFPVSLFLVIVCAGEDARRALIGSLPRGLTAADVMRTLFSLTALLVLLTSLAARASREPWPNGERARNVALLGVLGWLCFRLLFIATSATLRTDLTSWSEPPALLNLLKLERGEVFYGPMQDANTYSYSPGMELLQYWLLRPFGLQLSLFAHRALIIAFQLLSAAVLGMALWRVLSRKRDAAAVGLFAATACVVLSSLIAARVHPDHVMMIGFAAALWLCVQRPARSFSSELLLVAIPIFVTCFKLTGAGLGLGLVLVELRERSLRRLLLLAISGALALATIPLFDATLGDFSDYAIRLQASHPMDWERLAQVPSSPAGLMLVAGLLATLIRGARKPDDERVRAAQRVLLATLGFGLTSLAAFLKHGGRENSLLPLAIGGACALLLCVWPSDDGERSSTALALCFALALLVTPRFELPLGSARAEAEAMHAQQVSWLREGRRQGLRFLPAGMAAYLDAGFREVPRDALHAASELELGHRPELRAYVDRVGSGYYDGMCFPSSALLQNELLVGLTPALRARYEVSDPPELRGSWPTGLAGTVTLRKRLLVPPTPASDSSSPR